MYYNHIDKVLPIYTLLSRVALLHRFAFKPTNNMQVLFA
jgi:hypothetical protein